MYLAIHSGRYLYTNNLHVLIAAWLAASQRSEGGVRCKELVCQGVECKTH